MARTDRVLVEADGALQRTLGALDIFAIAPPGASGEDDAVRTFVARVLDDAGYVVESVSDGRTAVQLVRGTPVGLLLIDFAMHGMNGADVIAAARAFRPDLPVLMITGYADTDADAERAPGIPMLRKPFEADTLLVAVRDALTAGSKDGAAG